MAGSREEKQCDGGDQVATGIRHGGPRDVSSQCDPRYTRALSDPFRCISGVRHAPSFRGDRARSARLALCDEEVRPDEEDTASPLGAARRSDAAVAVVLRVAAVE